MIGRDEGKGERREGREREEGGGGRERERRGREKEGIKREAEKRGKLIIMKTYIHLNIYIHN